MNVWIAATVALLVALVPCGIVCLRGEPMKRLVGLQLANAIVTLILILLAQIMNRSFFYDLVLAQALLSFGGGLVLVRFLERWL
jgi:multicomponent Na+:H+ antiporter subunit F